MSAEPNPSGRRGWRALRPALVAAAAALAGWAFSSDPALPVAEGGHYGLASLLPALTTLLLVFLTRDVLSSLFLGIAVAGFVLADPDLVDRFFLPSLGTPGFALILLVYLWALGGLVGVWTRTGGARSFARWAAERMVRGPRSAKLFAWVIGVVFHQGGTISTVLAGTTVRAVTDEQGVAHEELAYIVDSTASPVATILPLNAWPLYVATLVAGTTPLFPTEQEAIAFFFRSVPFNFYGFLAVTLTLLFALEKLPWEGRRMRAARDRARSSGALDRPGAQPLSGEEWSRDAVPEGYRPGLEDFLVPMGLLLGIALTGVVRPLLDGLAAGSLDVFLSGISIPIAQAFGVAVLSAIALALLKGMRLATVIGGFVEGCRGVTIGALILALAVTLGTVSRELGTANYLVETTAALVAPVALPGLFLFLAMAVSFSIGSSWGTYAVVFPIAMPFAWAVHPDPQYLALTFGAVLGGAVFGDQCSPISDTTILSSLACGCDVMDHVLTQLPLALAAAFGAAGLTTLLTMVVL